MVNFSAAAPDEDAAADTAEDPEGAAAELEGELEHAASSSAPPATAAAASVVRARRPESVGNI
jgi:hypothetical protein